MLDVARHFRPLPDLFRFVDLLEPAQVQRLPPAPHRRPGLAAGLRALPEAPGDRQLAHRDPDPQLEPGDGTPHGGFYTATSSASLVRYAADRGVTIVPELEFPGHVRARAGRLPRARQPPRTRHRAWPRRSGSSPRCSSLHRRRAWRSSSISTTNCSTIFPSRYVHVGGDECPTEEWLASPEAAALAADRGLDGPDQLQRWFTEQLRATGWPPRSAAGRLGRDQRRRPGARRGAWPWPGGTARTGSPPRPPASTW